MKHPHAHTHHLALSYPVTLRERVYSIVIGPAIVIAILYGAVFFYPALSPMGSVVSIQTIVLAALYTLGRLVAAYLLAVLIGIPLAFLVTSNKTLEAIALPVFDVLQSVPILALFPVVVMLFVRFGNLNGAAIFILFLAMLWNLVFTLVGGIKIIPHDIVDAAHVFGVRGISFFRRVMLPAIVPQLVTGSILAMGQGWNITIVAEVLHTYIPGGTSAQDLFGIGSMLVAAAANAQNAVFVASVFVMVVFIAFINFFIWQRLLHYAQRFRFE